MKWIHVGLLVATLPQTQPPTHLVELSRLEGMAASGWMGDASPQGGETARILDGQTAGCRSGGSCYRVEFKTGGKLGWAGFAWQHVRSGSMNWGESPGMNLKDRGFQSLRVWARGQVAGGGTPTAQFKSGGNVALKFAEKNAASHDVAGPIVELSNEYQEFCLDLAGKDLRNVVSPFTVVLTRVGNPKGATVTLDDIAFSTEPCPSR
jgi:hypothetical protein